MSDAIRGYALLGAAVAALIGVVVWRGGGAAPIDPGLPPIPGDGTAVLERMAAEVASLRPADGAPDDAPATVTALLARCGSFGALGADDLHEALGSASGAVAAIPALLEVLGSPPPDDAPRPNHAAGDPAARLRRVDAARLLGAIGDSRAIPALGALLDSANADPFVQEAAAHALGAIGDRAALVPLLALLWDDRPRDWRISIAAALAALHLGARKGGDVVAEALTDWSAAMAKRPRVFDRERALLQGFLPLSGTMIAPYDPYMLPPELQASGAKWKAWWVAYADRTFEPASSARVSADLTNALLQPHLAHFDGRSFFSRRRAQRVLAGLRDDAIAYLLHELRHTDAEHRRHAAEALGFSERRIAQQELDNLVWAFRNEPSPLVRIEIVKAVVRLRRKPLMPAEGQAAATQLLERATLDSDPDVVAAARPAVPE